MFKTKNQKPKSRYEHVQFRSRLKQVRTHKRIVYSPTRQKIVSMLKFIASLWRVLLGLILLLALGLLIIFYKPLFFVTQVEIVGVSTTLETEVKQNVASYLSTTRWLLPQANILLLSDTNLKDYILKNNKLVWKVEKVEKRYPHRLIVTVAERAQTFVFRSAQGEMVYIANDGTILDDKLAKVGAMPIVWPGEHSVTPGSQFVTGPLLDTLLGIHDHFVAITGLEAPVSVEIVPLRVHATEATDKTTPSVDGALATSLLPKTIELADVPPQEVRVHMGANAKASMSAFYILLDVGKNTDEVLENLKLLLKAQSIERLSNLSYIDMRFGNKAFICLRTAPCTTQSDITTTPLK